MIRMPQCVYGIQIDAMVMMERYTHTINNDPISLSTIFFDFAQFATEDLLDALRFLVGDLSHARTRAHQTHKQTYFLISSTNKSILCTVFLCSQSSSSLPLLLLLLLDKIFGLFLCSTLPHPLCLSFCLSVCSLNFINCMLL